jgi:hypothetical protein
LACITRSITEGIIMNNNGTFLSADTLRFISHIRIIGTEMTIDTINGPKNRST